MNKKYDVLIETYINNVTFEELETFLLNNAFLPDGKINTSLSDAFADHFDNLTITPLKWKLLNKWASLSYSEAPTDSTNEFLCLCSVKGFCEFYTYGSVKEQRHILDILKKAMNDRRWKVRESSVMGLQRISDKNFFSFKKIVNSLIKNSTLLEKRAIIASLTHPDILKIKSNAIYSLSITEIIFKDILSLTPLQLQSVAFKVLCKTLESSVSIFVAYCPEEGFEMLKKFATVGEGENIIRSIIMCNLKKVRLHKYHKEEVIEISKLLKS